MSVSTLIILGLSLICILLLAGLIALATWVMHVLEGFWSGF